MNPIRCAIYTRKSVEEGLDQTFTTLDAQRDACAAYIRSQALEGWTAVRARYDDGGFSGANMQRPGLQRLLADIERRQVDVVVVYKIDRLTRSLADFAKIVDHLDRHQTSFISVTQAFNTSSSVGRLTLNILLTFAQFERELIGERLRDKIAASRARGIYTGGRPALGYRFRGGKLIVQQREAALVKHIFSRFLALGSVVKVIRDLNQLGVRRPAFISKTGRKLPVAKWAETPLRNILSNRVYLGEIKHRAKYYPGQHAPIVSRSVFDKAQRLLTAARHDWDDRRTLASSSLLTGMIADDKGNTMTPFKGQKSQGRVYKSHARHRKGNPDVISIRTSVVDPLVIRSVNACSAASDQVSSAETRLDRTRVRQVVRKVVVAADGVRIELRRDGERRVRSPDAKKLRDAQVSAEPDVVRIFFPLDLRPIKQVRIVEGWNGSVAPSENEPSPLLRSLALAYYLRKKIERNEVTTLEALARKQRSTPTKLLMALRLAYLAPDIQKLIVDGGAPAKLLSWRKNGPSLPLNWGDQREVLELPAQ